MTIRDIKRKARRDLHDAMRVPALFIAPGEDAVPILIHVRVHTKFEDLGEVSERDVGNALRHEKIPSLVFLIEELLEQQVPWRPMPRNAIVSVERYEAYKIDNTQPPDDITVTAHVTPLPLHETVNLPLPSDPPPEDEDDEGE